MRLKVEGRLSGRWHNPWRYLNPAFKFLDQEIQARPPDVTQLVQVVDNGSGIPAGGAGLQAPLAPSFLFFFWRQYVFSDVSCYFGDGERSEAAVH
jgi:hypothetical protein